MRTNIYIDGFNLYYGSLRGTDLKWLNIETLCRTLYPNITINRIRYFTAPVKSWKHDPNAGSRQQRYFRALLTIQNLTIHEGIFTSHPNLLPQYPLSYDELGESEPPNNVRVLVTREKSSDVNLATYLLSDCYENDCNDAIIISNDSDFVLPIYTVIQNCGINVRIINPQNKEKVSQELIQVAGSDSVMRSINKSALASSQFPPEMSDARGTFTKPELW